MFINTYIFTIQLYFNLKYVFCKYFFLIDGEEAVYSQTEASVNTGVLTEVNVCGIVIFS